jgi:hypothetical protein
VDWELGGAEEPEEFVGRGKTRSRRPWVSTLLGPVMRTEFTIKAKGIRNTQLKNIKNLLRDLRVEWEVTGTLEIHLSLVHGVGLYPVIDDVPICSVVVSR